MNRALLLLALVLAVGVAVEGKKRTHHFGSLYQMNLQNDDALLAVNPISPKQRGMCTCECCTPPPPQTITVNTPLDMVLAVDSSACFRDQHSRMIRWLVKLVRRISRDEALQFGAENVRLSIMQFSDEIKFPIHLTDFNGYSKSNRELASEITKALNSLGFIGQGAYLDKALNQTIHEYNTQVQNNQKKVVVTLTNGKSHPDVTLDDIESSITGLKMNNVSVIPVTVTRRCHLPSQTTWNDNLCPDVTVMGKLAKIGRNNLDFYTMKDSDSIVEIIDELKAMKLTSGPEPLVSTCNQCNCTCDLPVGPQGPQGPQGDSIKGEQGEIGYTGEVGPEGPQGEEGPQGIQGLTGEQGEQGIKGAEGEKGKQGQKGKTGKTGEVGLTGDKGEQGVQGEVGPEGPQGVQGEVGEVGEAGKDGLDGLDGKDGADGAKGAQGEQGEQGIGIKGDQGQKGGEGPQGVPGPTGSRGPHGNDGKQGLCGKPGPAGVTGEAGLTGLDGQDGQTGPEGQQGPRGYPGIQGNKGDMGSDGAIGDQGPRGQQGSSGPRGREGAPGLNGEKGEPSFELGPKGPQGMDGEMGPAGIPGNNGVDGAQGPRGVQGPRGPHGEKGECTGVDFEEFRAKIVEIIREMMPSECTAETVRVCEKSYPIDLVFLVDGSHSIPPTDFNTLKNWIVNVIDTFQPKDLNIPLYLTVVQFYSGLTEEVNSLVCTSDVTDGCDSLESIRRTVKAIKKGGGGTDIWTGLAYVTDTIGDTLRQDSQKILITITDGSPSDDENTRALADAKSLFDQMFAVGVGQDLNLNVLDKLSNDEPIHVTDFSALDGVIEDMTTQICADIQKHIKANGDRTPDIGSRGDEEPTPPQDDDDEDYFGFSGDDEQS